MCRVIRSGLAIALAIGAVTGAGCAYVQPQTYYLSTARVRHQQDDYLWNDVVTGMPEELFVHWYTREDSWDDDLRPHILGKDGEEGRIVYRVGSGHRTVMKVYFRDGRLEEVGQWVLTEEGPVYYWSFMHKPPTPPATEAILARLAEREPLSEPLRLEEIEAVRGTCAFEPGESVQTAEPLIITERRGERWLDGVKRGASTEGKDILPVGSPFKVKKWGVTRATLVDENGTLSRIDPDRKDGVCHGVCVREGEDVRLTRDLLIAAADEDSRRSPEATVRGLGRLPAFWRRRTLPAGTIVRLVSWNECAGLDRISSAVILVPGETRGDRPLRFLIDTVPPGLFLPAAAPGAAETASIPGADF